MSSVYSIDAPHTLFTLPRPLDSGTGRTLAGPSYSIHGSKKRKRAEVVLGVDGEGINIYDFKTPRLLTSHAIPPQAYLTARPCCAQLRSSPSRPGERYTYAALRNNLGSAKHEVACFQEQISKSSPSTSLPIRSAYPLGSPDNEVVFLEPIPNSNIEDKASPLEIVVVQDQGQIVGLSSELKREIWRTSVESLSIDTSAATTNKRNDIHVKYVSIQSAAVARKGILKGREDLTATFAPLGQSSTEILERTTIICLITACPVTGERRIHVFAVRPSTSMFHRSSPLQSVISWQLPNDATANSPTPTKAEYALDQASGLLFELGNGTLITYSFTSLGPKLNSKLEIPQQSVEGFLPAPYAMAVVASKGHCSLFNMRYTSLQASVDLNEIDVSRNQNQNQSRKRKRNDADIANTTVRLLDFFPGDNLIVGIVDNDLVIFSMHMPIYERRKSAVRTGRLIDSLGRGIAPSDTKVRIAPIASDAGAISALATLDPSLELLSQRLIQGKVMVLSGAVESLRHLLRSFNTPTLKPVLDTHLLTNGTSKTSDDESIESTFAAEEAALSADLALATSLLSPTALTARATALKTAISLLGVSYPTHSVVQALRTHLDRRDLLFLIQLLRLDMERGGWTSRVLDVWPSSDDEDDAITNSPANKTEKSQDAAIAVVCKVLNCALDALGMGAWVTRTHAGLQDASEAGDSDDDEDGKGQNGQKRTDDIISQLRAETEAALECVQESAFFKGFLGEFLRYESAAVQNKSTKSATSFALSSSSSALMTTIHSSSTAALSVADVPVAPSSVHGSMLPLGVRAAQGVSKLTIGAGGEVQKRSKRSTANELSKRTGIYAFERVRI